METLLNIVPTFLHKSYTSCSRTNSTVKIYQPLLQESDLNSSVYPVKEREGVVYHVPRCSIIGIDIVTKKKKQPKPDHPETYLRGVLYYPLGAYTVVLGSFTLSHPLPIERVRKSPRPCLRSCPASKKRNVCCPRSREGTRGRPLAPC